MFEYRGCLNDDGIEASFKTVQDAITTSQVPVRALKNFAVRISEYTFRLRAVWGCG
jgi:hypothetical protein